MSYHGHVSNKGHRMFIIGGAGAGVHGKSGTKMSQYTIMKLFVNIVQQH